MNNLLTSNQRVLAYWRGKVDPTDAFIVAHIDRIEHSHNPKIAARRIHGGYSWVDLNTLLRDNPVINMDYRGLKKRLRKLVDLGIIERLTFFENGRNRSYFKLSETWHRWVLFWEEHDTEEAARVYGWQDIQGNHSSPVLDTGEPQFPSDGNHSSPVQGNHSSHDSTVLLSGTPKGSDPSLDTLADQVIDYLNEKTGKAFQHSKSSRKHIRGRLADGATVEQCLSVIDRKADQWLHNDKMEPYLRPSTLFGPENFEAYVNERPVDDLAGLDVIDDDEPLEGRSAG